MLSLWQTPQAATLMRICPAPGWGMSRSTSSKPPFAWGTWATRIFGMVEPSVARLQNADDAARQKIGASSGTCGLRLPCECEHFSGKRAMDLGLRGRKALITGGSRGIGRACAEVLAAEGCDVTIVSRTRADLDAAKAKILGQSNVAVRTFAMDLSDSKNADILAAECPEIDILVNNAGAIPRGTIAEIDEARWREAWDLKVFGYINMTRRFYALMVQRKNGVIINIIGTA